jgi:hypothetical protein
MITAQIKAQRGSVRAMARGHSQAPRGCPTESLQIRVAQLESERCVQVSKMTLSFQGRGCSEWIYPHLCASDIEETTTFSVRH